MKAPELILDILEEQNSFAFTGTVIAKDKISGLESATLWFQEGQLVELKTFKRSGLKALYEVFFQEFLGVRFDYILNAEKKLRINQSIFFPLAQIKLFLGTIVDDLEDHDEFSPEKNLKLAIKPDFIIDGAEITELEYQVMELIAKYELVSEIYDKTELLGYEVTKALIELRKKEALIVVAVS